MLLGLCSVLAHVGGRGAAEPDHARTSTAQRPPGTFEALLSRDKRDVEQFGECHVRRVVHGEVLPQLPAAAQEWSVGYTVEPKSLRVLQGQTRPPGHELT